MHESHNREDRIEGRKDTRVRLQKTEPEIEPGLQNIRWQDRYRGEWDRSRETEKKWEVET